MDERSRERAVGRELLVAKQRMDASMHRIVPVGVGAHEGGAVAGLRRRGPTPDASEGTAVLAHELQRRMEHIESETPLRTKVRPHAPKGCEMVVLRQVVQERSKRSNDEREPLAQLKRAHVGRDHLDTIANLRRGRCFSLQRCEHVTVAVERIAGDAVLRQLERNAPRARSEFQHGSATLACLATVPVEIAKERFGYRGVVNVGVVDGFHIKTRVVSGFSGGPPSSGLVHAIAYVEARSIHLSTTGGFEDTNRSRSALGESETAISDPFSRLTNPSAAECSRNESMKSKYPRTFSSPHGFRCNPSCAHVSTSKNSSSVPQPPGRAMNASERSAIVALRSCIDDTTRSSVSPG